MSEMQVITRPLWTADEVATACDGVASDDFNISGVAFDSREVGPGDLFVALKGEQSDGHRFAAQALASGASGVLASEAIDGPHIRVADTTDALNALAVAARARMEGIVIGVTGSAGKTGTKEALFAALNRCSLGKAHRSLKSYNNHVGVPLSLTRMAAGTQFGVFEMGMNHAGELSQLTRLVRPHIVIITTIAPAHAGFFNSVEAIADAKGEICEGLEPGGVAILPFDSPHYARLRAKAEQHTDQIISFGFGDGADVRALDHIRAPGGGSLVTAQVGDRKLVYTLAETGLHWVSNSLAVLAATHAAHGDLASAGLALAELEGMAGRGKRHRIATDDGGKALLIDESYNANPASMAATIGELGKEPARRRLVVLGAMKELGATSDGYHIGLAEPMARAKVDYAVTVGDEIRILAEKLTEGLEGPGDFAHGGSVEEAIALIRAQLRDGDALLVKGSNGVGLSKLVAALVGERA